MKNLSIDEAVSALTERQRRFLDLVLPVSEIRMNEDGTLRMGSDPQHVPLQDQALTTLANRIGVQGGYLRRCEGDLLDLRAENVNRWLERLPQDRELLVRLDGSECRALLSTSYVPVSNLELLARFQDSCPSLNGDVRVNLEIDPIAMAAQIYWVTPECTVEHGRPGDISHLGIHLGNSEVGFHSVEIAAFMFRLVCSNGAVVAERTWCVRQTHLSCAEHLAATFDSLPEIIRMLPVMREQLHAARGMLIEDPLEEIKRLSWKHKLTLGQAELVRDAFRLNPDGSLFGLINAFTGAANREGIGWESRRTLQKVGGTILASVH